MKYIAFFLGLTLSYQMSFSQVGIGTVSPNASLDITSSSIASPSNTDGILIPRIDNFPGTNPASAQDGMLIFATGNGTPAKGFYYWDQNSTSWIAVGVSDTDWTSSGQHLISGNTGNVGIGTTPNAAKFQMQYTGSNLQGAQLEYSYSGTDTNAAALRVLGSGTNAGSYIYGGYFGLNNSGNSFLSTAVNGVNNANATVNIGVAGQTAGSGSDNAGVVGIASNGNNNTGGSFSATTGGVNNIGLEAYAYGGSSTNWAGYFGNGNAGSGNVYVHNLLRVNGLIHMGNPSTTGYSFPVTDGSSNQVLSTDGSGQLSFTDPSSIFDDTDWTLNGNDQYSSVTGNVGIGDTNPSSKLSIEGDGTSSATSGLEVKNGLGEVGFYVNDEGNVGIGTNDPVYFPGASRTLTLEAYNSASNNDYASLEILGKQNNTNSTIGQIIFGNRLQSFGEGVAKIEALGTLSSSYYGQLAFYTGNSSLQLVEHMRIDEDGNVGIGETNPSATLDLVGSFQYSDGNEGANRVLSSDINGNASWTNASNVFTDTDEQTIDTFNFNNGTNILTLEIENDGVPPRTVDLSSLDSTDSDWTISGNDQYSGVSGNVGIGNTNPNYTLDIEYSGSDYRGVNIDYTGNSSIGASSGILVTASNNLSGDVYGGSFLVNTSGTSASSFAVSGINSANSTTNTAVEARVTGNGTNNYGLYASATGGTNNWAGYFGNGTAGNGSGNVYVGDNLRVDDNFQYTDGTEAAGRVLRSDANGNARWADPSPDISSFGLSQANLSSFYSHGGTGYEKLPFNTIVFDAQSNFNTTTNRFVAPSAGYYRISASWHSIGTSTSVTDFGIGIYVNGSLVKQSLYAHQGNGVVHRDINVVVALAASQYVEIFANSSISGFLVDQNSVETWFEVEQIR
ncbi:beta strand repeat-containing protein [Constantimarinum furrinae]|uniref:C1q domain-containing protein n=1 Tax=Constantimarinum furrinae TaxID=2562285 RepID=A0A7G8PTU7_9FLAO|nr:hypothetical protein [Constantimarinum furrinae]QNJ97763.1 hypothetical protein ALE3EI_1195 [Constantimarinum furrinae]